MFIPTVVLHQNFYFNRIPRIWNRIPYIDINQSLPVIKATNLQLPMATLHWKFFTWFYIHVSIISAVDVASVMILYWQSISLLNQLFLLVAANTCTGCWQTISVTIHFQYCVNICLVNNDTYLYISCINNNNMYKKWLLHPQQTQAINCSQIII